MKVSRLQTSPEKHQIREIGFALDQNLTMEDNFKPATLTNVSSGGGTVTWVLNDSKLLKINAVGATPLTIQFTTNAPIMLGTVVVVDVVNTTGGAMGVVTFSSQFKTAGAFTSPAAGKRRTISFYWDGTNLIEIARSGADIT